MSAPRKTRTRRQGASTSRARVTERIAAAERRLREHASALRADIDRELRKYRAERDGLAADNVPDRAELSIADLVADVYFAEVDRDVVELLAVEQALRRVAAGKYGACIDCGGAVGARRLAVAPQAARCVRCQNRTESASPRPLPKL